MLSHREVKRSHGCVDDGADFHQESITTPANKTAMPKTMLIAHWVDPPMITTNQLRRAIDQSRCEPHQLPRGGTPLLTQHGELPCTPTLGIRSLNRIRYSTERKLKHTEGRLHKALLLQSLLTSLEAIPNVTPTRLLEKHAEVPPEDAWPDADELPATSPKSVSAASSIPGFGNNTTFSTKQKKKQRRKSVMEYDRTHSKSKQPPRSPRGMCGAPDLSFVPLAIIGSPTKKRKVAVNTPTVDACITNICPPLKLL
eukprot:m.112625 g.112625  ORF g.112625 m.112625 type:complete len:255 (-) comp28205_c0_seq1:313-1077(-)